MSSKRYNNIKRVLVYSSILLDIRNHNRNALFDKDIIRRVVDIQRFKNVISINILSVDSTRTVDYTWRQGIFYNRHECFKKNSQRPSDYPCNNNIITTHDNIVEYALIVSAVGKIRVLDHLSVYSIRQLQTDNCLFYMFVMQNKNEKKKNIWSNIMHLIGSFQYKIAETIKKKCSCRDISVRIPLYTDSHVRGAAHSSNE